MPVFSSVQLNSDSIGRENPAYSPGKQLICRGEDLLALVLLGPESADQGSGPRLSLSLIGPSQQALSPQRPPPSIVGKTRRRARRSFSLPGVSPARFGTGSCPGLRSTTRWSSRAVRGDTLSSSRPRRVDPKPRFPVRPAAPSPHRSASSRRRESSRQRSFGS